MRVHVAAIGKTKKSAEVDLIDDYVARVNKTGRRAGISDLRVLEFPESRAGKSAERKSEEAEKLLGSVPDGAILVAFDEHGKNITSTEFSRMIAGVRDEGFQNLVFLLGGPDGHDASILSKARFTLALGKMTWPHRLARIMVVEQLYRAVTIMLGHPYHRD